MKQLYPTRRLLTAAVVSLAMASCVDSAYDLSDINLKITLGPSGVTLPLGRIDSLTVDSMIRNGDDNKLKDTLVVENGFYAYKQEEKIRQEIDAIVIDPIRNVIPAIDPYNFRFTSAALPETVAVDGFGSSVAVQLPDFDFTGQALSGVSVGKQVGLGAMGGTTPAGGTTYRLSEPETTEDFSFSLTDIPDEIASVSGLYFSGTGQGSPIRVTFSPGDLAPAIQSGRLSLTITLPAAYTLALGDTYGGRATVSGSTLTLTDYPVPASGANLQFYLSHRTVTESISASRSLSIGDELKYSLVYTIVANGQPVPQSAKPHFSLTIEPQVDDAMVQTMPITPAPSGASSDVAFQIEGMDAVDRVNYIAFTSSAANTLQLRATHGTIPLQGPIPVQITLPEMFDFGSGIAGLTGHTLHTTLDKLTAGLAMPLRGVRLDGSDALVSNGTLSVSKPITVVVSPSFAGGTYKLSELETGSGVPVAINAPAMSLRIDPAACEVTAGFSEPIDIRQSIDQSFDVPEEVGSILRAEVVDAGTGKDAVFTISLDIRNSPVERCNFDNIDIVLPAFLAGQHANLDPKTNTIHIDRVVYTGRPVTIARITLDAVKNLPITGKGSGKQAHLKGEIRITATANVPDDSAIDGLDQTQITLLPTVSVPALDISYVTGKVDIDLKEYLTPTTIDLGSLRKSLGDEDIELNLVAPQIYLDTENPVGVAMIGDIILQPYDFSDNKLDPVVVKGISVEPSPDGKPYTTRIFVSDTDTAPEGYTLCKVEDLSKIVKTVPSKIEVEFDLRVDESREQSFAVTGEKYPLDINYSIRIPLKFKDNAQIAYTGKSDVTDTFADLDKYEITAQDVVVMLDAQSTLPLDMDVTVGLLDKEKNPVPGVAARVLNPIEGYDPETDGDYKTSRVDILLDIEGGDIRRLKDIATIEYKISGNAVGKGTGLKPDQYIKATMKLRLKKGITIDLDTL